MDPFTEKDLIECLRNIAGSLKNIDAKMADMTLAIREMGLEIEDSEDES